MPILPIEGWHEPSAALLGTDGNMFILRGMAPDLPLIAVNMDVPPFVAAHFKMLAFVIFFPALALWLPSTLFN